MLRALRSTPMSVLWATQFRERSKKLAPLRKRTVRIANCRRMCKFHFIVYGRHTRLRETHPEIAAEWDYKRNPTHLSPAILINTTVQPMWWKCSKCAKRFCLPIDQRTIYEKGCPNGCKPAMPLDQAEMIDQRAQEGPDVTELLEGEKNPAFASRNTEMESR